MTTLSDTSNQVRIANGRDRLRQMNHDILNLLIDRQNELFYELRQTVNDRDVERANNIFERQSKMVMDVKDQAQVFFEKYRTKLERIEKRLESEINEKKLESELESILGWDANMDQIRILNLIKEA